MNTIELERWKPSAENPRKMQYEGQRTAQEVYVELKDRLDSMGFLPDEYFLLNADWENGREIPEGADVFCTTDYGESEGIYLDVYLKWHENGKPITKSFITSKTLGESGFDLDRMFLISSAITKAFHGDHGSYARYTQLGEQQRTEDMILHLKPGEQRQIINALAAQRERLLAGTDQVEHLLLRMTGGILAYMDEVGERPLRLSDYDKALLAVREGNLHAFKESCPTDLNHAGDILLAVAGHPGNVGAKMLTHLLAKEGTVEPDEYLDACKRAVDTGDMERVQKLLFEADIHVSHLPPDLNGELIRYAYGEKPHMGRELVSCGTRGELAAAPPILLYSAAMNRDFQMMMKLVDSGASPGGYAEGILRSLTSGKDEWMAEKMLEHGMNVELDDYAAFNACIQNASISTAKLLLDRGLDLDQYREWAEEHGESCKYPEVMSELLDYTKEQRQAQGPQMGEMSL